MPDINVIEIVVQAPDAPKVIEIAIPGKQGPTGPETVFDSISDAQAAKIPSAILAVRTNGYSAAGDGGAALYKKVGAEPSHAGKFQSADGAWWELSVNAVYPEMFGARADPAVDDWQAFQDAINYSRILYLRGGKNYYIGSGLAIPRTQQIHCSSSANADTLSISGTSKLVFSGGAAGKACFYNAVTGTMMSHGGFFGFSIRVLDDYDWVFDFNGAVQQQWIDLSVTTVSTATGGIRTTKINPADPSWLNRVERCDIILPLGTPARPLDMDWSDSDICISSLSGGVGSIDKGFGNRFHANNLERSTGNGLTLKMLTTSPASIVTGNFFDLNGGYGVAIDVDGNLTASRSVGHIITANKFRSVHPVTSANALADIGFVNNTGNIYTGGYAKGNRHGVAAVPAYAIGGPTIWTGAVLGDDLNLNPTFSAFGKEILDKNYYSGPQGLNLPSGIVAARGTNTQFGMTNVSGFFGANAGGGAGIQMGAEGSANPFIAASRTIAGVATDLRFYTDATERLRLNSGGAWFRPAADNAMQLGSASSRWSQLFAGTATISTSDEREKKDIEAIQDKVLDAWGEVEWCQFRFRVGTRLHTGLVAQRVRDVFLSHGLDATDYGLLCYDEWEDAFEPVMESRITESGTEEIYDTGEVVKVREAGSLWGVRYEESLAMEAAYQRRMLDRLETRLRRG